MPNILGNQEIACPLVGLAFLFTAILENGFVDKDTAAVLCAVENQVGRFVEEGEPDVIVGLVLSTQLDNCLVWSHPARCTAQMGVGQQWNDNQRDTGSAAKARGRLHRIIHWCACQFPYVGQRRAESLGIKVVTLRFQ